jgi:YbbR domain-containing protein
LAWKVFSLATAIMLWFIVMNTLNPTEIKTFTATVSIINDGALADNGLVLLNKQEVIDTKVSIKVKGTRPALDELSKAKNKAEIKAVIDLEQLNSVSFEDTPLTYSLLVTPSLPDSFNYSYDIASCTPSRVDAQLDELVSEELSLTVNTTGQLGDGYKAEKPVPSESKVTVTGPKSMFSQIASVKADVDINGKTSDVTVSTAPAVYNASGEVMPMFKVEPNVVDVTVGINKLWQIPVKAPETTGELEEGLELKSIDYSPKYAEVEGKTADFNKIDSIELPDIDLSSVVATRSFTYDIRPYLKDADVNIRDGSPTQITVTVTVEATEKRTLTINDFEIKNLGQNLDATPKSARVTLKGRKSELDTITAASLNPQLDLSNLEAGEHSCDITLDLPEGIEVYGDATTTVVITEAVSDTSDTPADSEAGEQEEAPSDNTGEDETVPDNTDEN